MSGALHLHGGHLFDPASGLDGIGDVLVADGRIAAVGRVTPPPGAETVELRGCHLFPGLVDMHVHLRTPGQTAKETFETGLRAAVRGGFTAVGAMPNTTPVLDSAERTADVERRANALGLTRLHQYGATTLGSEGEALGPFWAYREAGVLAVTDDGRPVARPDVMVHAMEEAKAVGLLLVEHAEDPLLAGDGVAHWGRPALGLGLPAQRAEAESSAIARDVVLAAATGARLHLAHVSTRESVDVIRWAKRQGVAVTAEATPHHLTLTDAELARLGTRAKMNPPLRSEADREALLEALSDGTIDAVATDHAPHTEAEKARGWLLAPFGVSGLETALAVLYTDLVLSGRLTLKRLIEALASRPAEILGLSPRAIRVGAEANLTAFDPQATWTVHASDLATMGKNSPYLERTLTGRPRGVVVEGRWVGC